MHSPAKLVVVELSCLQAVELVDVENLEALALKLGVVGKVGPAPARRPAGQGDVHERART